MVRHTLKILQQMIVSFVLTMHKLFEYDFGRTD